MRGHRQQPTTGVDASMRLEARAAALLCLSTVFVGLAIDCLPLELLVAAQHRLLADPYTSEESSELRDHGGTGDTACCCTQPNQMHHRFPV